MHKHRVHRHVFLLWVMQSKDASTQVENTAKLTQRVRKRLLFWLNIKLILLCFKQVLTLVFLYFLLVLFKYNMQLLASKKFFSYQKEFCEGIFINKLINLN